MAVWKEHFDEHDEQNEHEKDNSKKRTRITIDISPYLRKRIKIAAAESDLSIGEFLSNILEEAIPDKTQTHRQQGHPVTREAIERLRQLRKQIMEDRQGRPFEESSTEMLERAREERTRELMGEE